MTMAEFVKAIELERFRMGMGVVEFAKYLGIHYHTYQSFRMNDRSTTPKIFKILLDFAQSKGIKTNELEMD